MTVVGYILSILCGFALLGFMSEMAKYVLGIDEWNDLRHTNRL